MAQSKLELIVWGIGGIGFALICFAVTNDLYQNGRYGVGSIFLIMGLCFVILSLLNWVSLMTHDKNKRCKKMTDEYFGKGYHSKRFRDLDYNGSQGEANGISHALLAIADELHELNNRTKKGTPK